jgi:hypothetical protein
MRLVIALSSAAVVGGLILMLAFPVLLGPILIIGGVARLGVAVIPTIIDRFVQFLSTGSMRRKRW